MLNEKVYKSVSKFQCIPCDYIARDKYIYDRHINTQKHYMLTNANKKVEKVAKYKCLNCDKEYLHQPSLSRHKNVCKISTDIVKKTDSEEISDISDKELINKLLET